MGLLDKLQFWKKSDDLSDLGLGKDFDMGGDIGFGDDKFSATSNKKSQPAFNPSEPTPMFGHTAQENENDYLTDQSPDFSRQQPQQPMNQQFKQQQFQQPYQQPYPQQFQQSNSPDLQLISAKLDAIKAYLDSINQRLTNLENMARGHNERRW